MYYQQSCIHCNVMIRYLSRALLVPFVFEAPEVEIGVLTEVLEQAPSAFPALLSVGRKIELLKTEELHQMQERVASAIVDKVDSQLCTQYWISITCAQEV